MLKLRKVVKKGKFGKRGALDSDGTDLPASRKVVKRKKP